VWRCPPGRSAAQKTWENGREEEARAKGLDRELDAERRDADDALSASGRELSTARAELDGHIAAASRVIDDDRVQALVPGATDAWVVGSHLRELVTAAVLAGRAESRGLAERLEQLRSELDALGLEGLLPPSEDVRRVWEVLLAAGIGATSGWKWLAEKLDGDERVAALKRNPGLAGGVLLTDPDRLGEARRALVEAGVQTSGVVVLGSPAGLGAEATGSPAPVRPAQYDPAWTQRERAQREAEAEEVECRLRKVRAALGIDEPLLDLVSDLLRRCPPGPAGPACRDSGAPGGHGYRRRAAGAGGPAGVRGVGGGAGGARGRDTRPSGRRPASVDPGPRRRRAGPPGGRRDHRRPGGRDRRRWF
jgi:hypothetical protein